MATSDLRAEVEIWLFHACAMHPAILLLEQFVHCGQYNVPENVFLVTIRNFSGTISSGNMTH